MSQWLLLGIFIQKEFETNLNFRYQKVGNQKNKGTIVLSTFKIDTTKCLYCFQICFWLKSFVPKIEICLKYILYKKQPLWDIRKSFDMYQQVLCHQKSFPVSECTSKLSAGDSSLEIINCVCHSSGSSKFLRNIDKKDVWKLYSRYTYYVNYI